ncbi:hypothetical protein M8818_001208 [Zalaria obscura]|uniref:Uncharacterized protein n=1 Tax=Zalaria obscura TaxID=2024903 RepID=A0ACC3SKI0_9PEZI
MPAKEIKVAAWESCHARRSKGLGSSGDSSPDDDSQASRGLPRLCGQLRSRTPCDGDDVDFSRQRCLRHIQDPACAPSNHAATYPWYTRKRNDYHCRHLLSAARTRQSAKGGAEVQRHITGLRRPLQL